MATSLDTITCPCACNDAGGGAERSPSATDHTVNDDVTGPTDITDIIDIPDTDATGALSVVQPRLCESRVGYSVLR